MASALGGVAIPIRSHPRSKSADESFGCAPRWRNGCKNRNDVRIGPDVVLNADRPTLDVPVLQ
jgi:hypothetical protein